MSTPEELEQLIRKRLRMYADAGSWVEDESVRLIMTSVTPPPPVGEHQQLIDDLKACNSGDIEDDHADADRLLLDYINDLGVTEAYDAIDKWYA